MKKWMFAVLFLAAGLSGCSVGLEDSYTITNPSLTNLNPDPQGDPWIAGGLVMPSEEELLAIPQLEMVQGIGSGGTPPMVDNTLEKAFRPVFSQYGGSCAMATGIGYVYTYEINALRKADASLKQNQYPSGYTWNAVNNAQDQGSWYTSGWDLVKLNGIPSVEVYNGNVNGGQQYSDYSRYMSGYQNYISGLTNQLDSYYAINVGTPEGVQSLRQWLYDHGRNQFPGGVCSFACNISGAEFSVLGTDSSQSGKQVLTSMGDGGGHGMTIAGYDDQVKYDYNGDGQYTTDIDINGDGQVNVKDWEVGAVLVVNSWGSYWQDGGKVWMMYKVLADTVSDGGIWNNQVYVVNAQTVPVPRLIAKIRMNHSGRNGITITLGVSADTNAQYPSHTKSFARMFNSSGAVNMIARTITDPIELSLDMQSLADKVDLSRPVKFFLQVYEYDYSSQYVGSVREFSVVDTQLDKEYFSAQFDVPVANGTTTTLTAVNTDRPVSTYSQMYFRGTPNSWNAGAMTLVSNFTWMTTQSFSGQSTDRFKFDVHANWALNFGDNNADGIAEQSGDDIYLSAGAGEYIILFNDRTLKYSFKADGVPSPKNLRFSFQNTNLVMLSWDAVPGVNGYVISREPANGYASFATTQNAGVYAGRCEVGESYVYTVRAYTGVPYPQKYSAPVTVNVSRGGFAKVYDQVYLRGTFNTWSTTEMNLIADNTWRGVGTFGSTATERFKFDIRGDWSLNFGDNNADGIAEQSGQDIPVQPGSTYAITFNDLTRAYTVSPLSGTVEATPQGGNAPSSELLGINVQILKGNTLVAEKPFVLDGSSYIMVRFTGLPYGEYTLKVNTTKNGYLYSGTGSVTVSSANTSYVSLAVNKGSVPNGKTIHYYSTWSQAYLHYQKDGGSWTAVPGVAMNYAGNQWYTLNVQDEDSITFCFNNGNGIWDSRSGQNYTGSTSELWVKNGVVTTYQP